MDYTSIKLNVTSSEFIPAKNLSKGHPMSIQEEFAEFLANEIKNKIISDIDTQKRRSKWKPLSFSYLQEKMIKRLSTNTWEATGVLKKSISVTKVNNSYVVGIDPSLRYKDSGLSVLLVARKLEYGTAKVPSRPLFRPTFNNYRVYSSKLYEDFIKKNHPELLVDRRKKNESKSKR